MECVDLTRLGMCVFSYIFYFRAYQYNGHMRGACMISYEPLFKTMKEKNISSYELAKRGFSRSTYYAIKQGKSITTNSVNQLCSILNCKVADVMEYIEEG
ncbi:MAG: helix-turn-helix domain-containing protein [Blautia sp.]